MKKVLAFILVLLLLISFVCPVSAQSLSDKNEMSAVELSIKRFIAVIKGKSQIELADEILSELGMNDRFIKSISADKKEAIASSVEICTKTEYIKCDENGIETLISKKEYDNKERNILNVSTNGNLDVASKEDDGKDSLFIRNLYILRPNDNTPGVYIILGSYEYKKMPFWRGTDVLSVSGEDLAFARKDFSVAVLYDEETVENGKTEKREISEYYDMNTIEDANDLKGFSNAMTFKYDLPNNHVAPSFDGTGGGMKTEYSNLGFLVLSTAKVNKPSIAIDFNIYFNYFHQKIGLGSLGMSVGASGASVSVSPKFCYEMHQIMLDEMIAYRP